MRAIIITLAAAFSASAFAFDAPELEPADDQGPGMGEAERAADLDTMMRASEALRRLSMDIRARERGEGAACGEYQDCADAYLAGMAVQPMAAAAVSLREEGNVPQAMANAEVVLFQAAFAFDAWREVQQQSDSPAVCQAMRQSALLSNAAMGMIEAGCEGSDSQTCMEFPEQGMPRMEIPECGLQRRVDPRGGANNG